AGSVTTSAPGRAFASMTAARSVHVPLPAAVSQRASPGVASGTSSISFTTNVAALASRPARSSAADRSELTLVVAIPHLCSSYRQRVNEKSLEVAASPGGLRWPCVAVRIGISGWRYPPWRGVFYPLGLP